MTTVRLTAESGLAAYDSAHAVLARNPVAVFAVSVRAVAWRGSIGLPAWTGGTTIAGLEQLEKHSLRNALVQAVRKATERSKELAGG